MHKIENIYFNNIHKKANDEFVVVFTTKTNEMAVQPCWV